MTLVEIAGTLSSLGGIYFATQGKRIAWPLQIIGSTVYLPLFWEVHLFAQGVLHLFYIILGIYGWYNWRPLDIFPQSFAVSRLSRTQWIYLNVTGILATGLIGQLQIHFLPADIPYLDSSILVFGLIAQWMQAAKKIENWGYWIILDTVAAAIYWYKELYLIAALYMIYTFIALYGWRKWLHHYTRANLSITQAHNDN